MENLKEEQTIKILKELMYINCRMEAQIKQLSKEVQILKEKETIKN